MDELTQKRMDADTMEISALKEKVANLTHQRDVFQQSNSRLNAEVEALRGAAELLARQWDGCRWEEGDDVGATIRHDFAMHAEMLAAAPLPPAAPAPKAELTDELAAFEKFATAKFLATGMWGCGTQYTDTWTQRSWEAWQARAVLEAPSAAPAHPAAVQGWMPVARVINYERDEDGNFCNAHVVTLESIPFDLEHIQDGTLLYLAPTQQTGDGNG